jgi:hypothetical protein
MRNRSIKRAAICEALIFLVILGLMVAVFMTSGCAGAFPQYDMNGNIIGVTGYGFLRDLEIEQVKPDGSRFSLKSKSTTGDLMRAGNEIVGTAVNAAAKVP